MKTHTSKRNIWLRSIVILPLIAFSIYGFSERKEVIREVALDQIIPQNTEEHETANPILEISFHPETFLLNGQKTSLNQLKKDFINVTNGLKSDLDIKVKGGIQMSLINQIMDTLKGNLGKINLDEKTYIFESKDDIKPILEVEMNPLKLYLNGKETTLENLENDFNELTKNTKSDVILRSNDLVSKPFIDKVWKLFGKNIGSIITEVGKTSVTKEGINSSQQKATPEEFSEYNKLAKHSNSKLSNELPIIKVKDIKRLEYLYGKMSDDQKKNAESYPDFSNVPGPPVMDTIFTYNRLAKRIISIPENRKNNIDYLNKKYNEMSSDLKSKVNSPSQISTEVNLNKTENANENQSKEYKTGFLDVNGETLFYTIIAGKTTFYNRNGYKVSKNGELLNGNTQVDASEVLPGQYITKVYQNDAVVAVFKENVSETKKTIPQTKSKEMVMLNGKKTKDGGFTITKKELDNFELSIKEGVITDFMMKTPGKPTQSIKGNTLNEEAKSLLNALSRGDTFQLILIKNSNNEVHPPLFVEIK